MQFKGITTQVGGRLINIELPDTKSIALTGDNQSCDFILDVIRSLLTCDYTNELEVFGGQNTVFKTRSTLTFTNGTVSVKNKSVIIDGKIPKLHILDVDEFGGLASVIMSDSIDIRNSVGIDTTNLKFLRTQLADIQVRRLVELMNRYAGYDAISIGVDELKFNFEPENASRLQVAYMTLAESFLTPDNFLRIVLLHNCSFFDEIELAKFVELLDNVPKLEMLFVSGKIDSSSLSANSVVKFVNV